MSNTPNSRRFAVQLAADRVILPKESDIQKQAPGNHKTRDNNFVLGAMAVSGAKRSEYHEAALDDQDSLAQSIFWAQWLGGNECANPA